MLNVGFYRADLAGRGFLTQGKQGFVFPSIYLYHLDWNVGNTQITSIATCVAMQGGCLCFLITRVTVDLIYGIT